MESLAGVPSEYSPTERAITVFRAGFIISGVVRYQGKAYELRYHAIRMAHHQLRNPKPCDNNAFQTALNNLNSVDTLMNDAVNNRNLQHVTFNVPLRDFFETCACQL